MENYTGVQLGETQTKLQETIDNIIDFNNKHKDSIYRSIKLEKKNNEILLGLVIIIFIITFLQIIKSASNMDFEQDYISDS